LTRERENMQDMAAKTPTPTTAQMAAVLRKVDRAAAAHEKTRQRLEEAVAEARDLGCSLTVVAEHARYSREWVRKATARVTDDRGSTPEGDDEVRHVPE
jgi:16S rRNA C967 or C1407 C5-methylase (RsmB/RsmF family)